MILCGPTGSDKATTIYSILRSVDAVKNNVLTAESPIEVLLENISYTQVDDDSALVKDLRHFKASGMASPIQHPIPGESETLLSNQQPVANILRRN